jgi:hypothetical protein
MQTFRKRLKMLFIITIHAFSFLMELLFWDTDFQETGFHTFFNI